eukprot:GHVT01103764.1.p1 GENE.GHVT01103764.1~~GHVT01103764.1.p1  ORF type:complete len:310 (-),score=54.44 GHVT01103764.1:14-943(-)
MELTSKFPDILFEWHRGKTKNVLKTNKTDGFTFDDFSAPLVRNAARSIQECATDQILNQLQEMALKCRMDNGFPNFQLVAQPKPTVQTGKTNDASSGAADANDASSITTDASTFPLSEPVTVEEETSTGAPSVAASNTCQPCGNNNTEAPGSDSLNLNSDCPEPDQSPQQKLQTQGGHSSNKPVNTCITDVKSSESTTSPTSSPAPSTSSLPGPASPEVSTEASAHEDTEAQASGVATVSKNNKKKKWLDKGKDWFKQFFRKSSDSNVSNKKSNGGSSSNAASSQGSLRTTTPPVPPLGFANAFTPAAS